MSGALAERAERSGRKKRQLPRGRHSLSPEAVRSNQRDRLLTGGAKALAAHGYPELTVAQIIDEAAVSRATFYEQFDGKRECVLAAHRRAFDRLNEEIEDACEGIDDWQERIAVGLGAALRFSGDSPCEAGLLTIEGFGGDPVLGDQVLKVRERLALMLTSGRRSGERAGSPPAITEQALIAGIASIVAGYLRSGRESSLVELEPELVELVLLPYRRSWPAS